MAGMKVRDRSGDEGMSAVSVQHGSEVSAARLVVVEDNSSDVYLLERALRKQNLRFELLHLISGSEALAFIRRQGAYADAAIPGLMLSLIHI